MTRSTLCRRCLSSDDHSSRDNKKKKKEMIHLIVLVHGWLGNELEMDYLRQSLERQSTISRGEQQQQQQQQHQIKGRVIIHSAISNVGRTWDGIAAGGLRLADEIDHVVDKLMIQQQQQQQQESSLSSSKTMSLSLVGNSLGGLYARYALGHMSSSSFCKKIQPILFCTTATPHLGVSQHTYVKLPRMAEYVIATAMQPTGRDLFRVVTKTTSNPILDTLCEPHYLKPLAAFSKRIAVANAYGTDVPVPTATAAFLASTNSPHYQVVIDNDDNNKETTIANYEVLTVTTPRTYYDHDDDDHDDASTTNNEKGGFDDGMGDSSSSSSSSVIPLPLPSLSVLATRLDTLGWQKIFYDVRKQLPTVMYYRRQRRQQRQDPSILVSNNNNKKTTTTTTKPQRMWTSQQLLDTLCDANDNNSNSSSNDDGRLSLPFGHTMLVANSRSRLSKYFNRGGQPIMDRLASTILQEIRIVTTTTTTTTSPTRTVVPSKNNERNNVVE